MANKRTLKRNINLICEDLFAECIAVFLYGTKTDEDNQEALLSSIVRLQNDYISRISHPEPGIKASLYYKDLKERFSAEVDDILGQVNNSI